MESQAEEHLDLYEKRIPIVTRWAHGKFRNFKSLMLWLAYAVFFLLPWLPWHRHSGINQAVAFDLIGRRFFIFDLVVYPQNVFWLAWLLFIAATFLFFMTTLVGRAFCGYFCFQTLWTDAFMMIERLVQGERPARLKLIKQPWNGEKVIKIGITHTLWLVVSFWTALTFVLYFGYAPELLRHFFTGQAAEAAYIGVGVLTMTTYIAAGFMREQVCAYICPYGRFQSVMYEPDTLVVTYEYRRGENKKGRSAMKGELKNREVRQEQGYGDCIDCGICVQVCPVGIDIRDGLQYRCISCGLCIDGCNEVMGSVGFPKGLIRYDSEVNMKRDNPEKPHLSWKRLKVLGYLVALTSMTSLLVVSVMHHTDFEYSVQQVRQPLFVVLSSGAIRNRYDIHLTNQSDEDQVFHISTEDLPPGALDLGPMQNVLVHPGNSVISEASVILQPNEVKRYSKFEFVIQSLTEESNHAEVSASFNSEKSTL